VTRFSLDKLARKLIDQGMHVNARNYQGCISLQNRDTALIIVAKNGLTYVVQQLLDKETDTTVKNWCSGQSALQ